MVDLSVEAAGIQPRSEVQAGSRPIFDQKIVLHQKVLLLLRVIEPCFLFESGQRIHHICKNLLVMADKEQ